jgi:hypothetical protein
MNMSEPEECEVCGDLGVWDFGVCEFCAELEECSGCGGLFENSELSMNGECDDCQIAQELDDEDEDE